MPVPHFTKNLQSTLIHNAEERAALEDQVTRLRNLALDMGRAIRAMDSDNEHLDIWTQDGDYIIDARWSA